MFTMSCCLNRGGTREREGARGPPNFPQQTQARQESKRRAQSRGKTYLIDRSALHSESRGQMPHKHACKALKVILLLCT